MVYLRRRVENGEFIVIDIADVVDGQHLLQGETSTA
jgi:hypothetical protein